MRRGKCPRARPDRITSFGIAHAGHPSSHALPAGGGHELIYAAPPEATQVAGGRCRVRACRWAVRGTHDSFEGRRSHTCSAVLAAVSYTTSSCSQCTAARLSTPVRARGRGERVRGERVVARCFGRPLGDARSGRAGVVWGRRRWAKRPATCLPVQVVPLGFVSCA